MDEIGFETIDSDLGTDDIFDIIDWAYELARAVNVSVPTTQIRKCSAQNSSLFPCDPGFQCTKTNPFGKDEFGFCFPCRFGEFCPEGTINGEFSLSAASCPSGHFCNLPNSSIICPPGYACPQYSVFPIPCSSPGVYCPLGSTNYSLCSPGFYCPDSAQKILCPDGFYCKCKGIYLKFYM